jgi:hypothetical protein
MLPFPLTIDGIPVHRLPLQSFKRKYIISYINSRLLVCKIDLGRMYVISFFLMLLVFIWTILASLVLDSTGFWARISARTPILRNITTVGDITGGFCPGAGFPSCHKSIYRVSEDNFRGSACVSEWMLISAKDGGLVFHNLRTINLNK